MILGQCGNAFGQLRARLGRDRLADPVLVEFSYPLMLVFSLISRSNHCRRAGLAKRLDQSGHPGVAGNQSPIQFDIDLKNQPIRHFSPRDSLREVDVTDEAPI